MSEIEKSDAGDSNSTVENSSVTIEQFVARRSDSMKKKASPPESKGADQAKPEETKPAEEPTNKEGGDKEGKETEGSNVLSQKDLSEFTDEEIAELAQKGKSGLLRRVAELTAKRKLAEEKLLQMEQMLRSQQSAPKPVEPKVENNPFAKIATAEELSVKAQEIAEVVEWAEDVLDRAESLSPDDVAATVDGKQLTKAEVKQHLRDARRAKDKFIPAQQRELAAKVQRKQLREALEANARKEFDWLSSNEDNDTRRQYQNMLNDPRIKPLEDAAPDVAAQLPYILAHAANSMYGRKSIPIEQTPTIKAKPPASPVVSNAQSEKPEANADRAVKEQRKRLAETGSVSDFIALRTQQISKRQKLK